MCFRQGYHTVLIVRFVLSLKVTVLENFLVLIYKKCSYFGLASLFYLIFSNNVRKRLKVTDDL